MYLSYHILCRHRRHNNSALSFDAEKEGAGCSAAARAIPRKTTCGGFWYFWPQKYKKKKVCENCNLPETSRSFSVKFRKTFFSAFRWRKAAKATRPIPMPASGRLKAASGDYSQVCKQTVPAALAFSPPSALSPSEPSRESPCGVKNKAHVTETYLSLFILCRPWRHHKSALPRRTTCGGFWYF